MSANEKTYTVGQVAEMTHVTVRTLHHYDEIGLLVPSDRSASGYRLYDPDDLDRLHDILLYRELGLPLEAIRHVIDGSVATRLNALLSHRERLETRVERSRSLLRAVDRRIEALEEGRQMGADTAFEGFEEFDHEQYEEETRERWGDTDPYGESARRTRDYDEEQWKRIRTEAEAIEARWAERMEEGKDPRHPLTRRIAEEHRLHIERWFYPCSHRMHAGLADMYERDPRFRAHYDDRREGLAAFVTDSIRANADEAGGGGAATG